MTDQADDNAVLLEVCIDSLSDAVRCAELGIDRVELNSALELGGLTPSVGLAECVVEALRPTKCQVIAMVRPRPGGFAYDGNCLTTMQRDVDKLIEAGVDGLAFGALEPDGAIAVEQNRELIGPVLDAGKQAVFHRAFDVTPAPLAALETLVELGFTRLLTSGGHQTAAEGAAIIRALIEQAAGRIEILPGGGIRDHNVLELIQETGCNQVHMSARSVMEIDAARRIPPVAFNSDPAPEPAYHGTDPVKLKKMVEALRGLDA